MIGERVRLAREACCLTQQQLAQSAGVSQSAVSDIESGRVAVPSHDTVRRVAQATHFPEAFFELGPLPGLPEGHYRRLARGTSKVDRQVRAQVRQILEVVQRAEGPIRLPRMRIVAYRDVADLSALEKIALDIRESLGIESHSPISNLTRAVERAGVIVVRLPGRLKDHDSFSAWPDDDFGGRPVIALAGGHPGDRDRFNVAHELGHLVLHTARPHTDHKQAETEAHRFAGALLLPRRSAIEAMRPPITLRVLMGVKATYGISMAAAARRALDLGLVSKDQYRSINKQLSARQWKKHEPVEVPQEKPVLIAKIVDAMSGQGSTYDRATRLAMPVFTYRALMGQTESEGGATVASIFAAGRGRESQ